MVLNARRHRSGNYLRDLSLEPFAREGCSTPEGIGAGITRPRGCPTTSSAAASAQHPKASERELLSRRETAAGNVYVVLNARRHRSGNYAFLRTVNDMRVEVLNARRHRSGNYFVSSTAKSCPCLCSTPEGIGAGITGTRMRSRRSGTGAQRPKASERELLRRSCRNAESRSVLNARRHRSGNYTAVSSASVSRSRLCSTPEGIGAGITLPDDKFVRADLLGCSTPEGIGAGITWAGRRGRAPYRAVLNARRHRSGNYSSSSCAT